MRLLDANAAVYREVVPRLVKVAPEAIILVVTDPPDPLADLARELAGHDRVLSTGTYLDSLRFQFHLAKRLQVSSGSVEALVIGEHGTSEVFLWSGARVGGMPADQAIASRDVAQVRQAVEQEVRYANITIVEGTGASQFGIGMVSARIAEIVVRAGGSPDWRVQSQVRGDALDAGNFRLQWCQPDSGTRHGPGRAPRTTAECRRAQSREQADRHTGQRLTQESMCHLDMAGHSDQAALKS